VIFFVLLCLAASGQVSTSYNVSVDAVGFSSLTDSTYQGRLTNFNDQYGIGYTPLGVAVGFKIVDAGGQMFTITQVVSTTFFEVQVIVEEDQDPSTIPFGRALLYEPLSSDLIPPGVQNSPGLSPLLRARVDVHNAINTGRLLESGTGSVMGLRIPGHGYSEPQLPIPIYRDTLSVKGWSTSRVTPDEGTLPQAFIVTIVDSDSVNIAKSGFFQFKGSDYLTGAEYFLTDVFFAYDTIPDSLINVWIWTAFPNDFLYLHDVRPFSAGFVLDTIGGGGSGNVIGGEAITITDSGGDPVVNLGGLFVDAITVIGNAASSDFTLTTPGAVNIQSTGANDVNIQSSTQDVTIIAGREIDLDSDSVRIGGQGTTQKIRIGGRYDMMPTEPAQANAIQIT
ncbi:MAG: hypothetical protein R3204_15930, partial [Oceanospirillum sp.]|nr:hypothetical protein [Oceanospirillum sp.]